MNPTPLLSRSSHSLRRLTLNNEGSLNALTLEMAQELYKELSEPSSATQVFFLEGAGEKAFCAGGDIRRLYQALLSPAKDSYPQTFFKEEYRLDYTIHSSATPIVVWGHGVVMGGGLGLMAGAQYRIVTEKTLMAMPEITIGLYPDVGASYFLNRMPKSCGLFCGLTGLRLNASDVLYLGLGDFFISNSFKEAVIEALSQNPSSIRKILTDFQSQSLSAKPDSEVEKRKDLISEIIGDGKNISDILSRFEKNLSKDIWLEKPYQGLTKGSPTSAAFIVEQLNRSSQWTLKECFEREYGFSTQFSRRHDFREGIRALLIEKDMKPQWSPAQLEKVTSSWIEEHFAPLEKGDFHL